VYDLEMAVVENGEVRDTVLGRAISRDARGPARDLNPAPR